MQLIIKHHRKDFKFKEPPYEYEFHRMPIDLILGSKTLRKKLTNLEDLILLSYQWQNKLTQFKLISGKYHLYE
jgi:uncharacterized protein YbbC (DUF1343 family)